MEMKTESDEINQSLDFSQKKRKFPTISFEMDGGSQISLRPNSPKTLEACRELGLDPEIFRKKFVKKFSQKRSKKIAI